jgi:hypothetical protein
VAAEADAVLLFNRLQRRVFDDAKLMWVVARKAGKLCSLRRNMDTFFKFPAYFRKTHPLQRIPLIQRMRVQRVAISARLRHVRRVSMREPFNVPVYVTGEAAEPAVVGL